MDGSCQLRHRRARSRTGAMSTTPPTRNACMRSRMPCTPSTRPSSTRACWSR
jgi:hypothetical protein